MTDPAVDVLFLSFQAALAGRYSLEREVGRGGMGVVYLAREVRLDRLVAIKLLPPELASNDRLRDRFMREARTAARLSHPNIVPIHAVDEIGGFVFYVMAFVDGETLAQRVAKRGPVPPQEATRLLREVAWALAYAHGHGVVHRDIKPANILLEGGTGRAMVADFGIARLAHLTGETAVGELLGTPEYMSPEQAGGDAVDGRSDLYSLGVVGFYAITGALPFSAQTAQAVLAQQLTKSPPPLSTAARGVPRSLALAIDRCLQKDPAARYDRGEALADALASGLEKQPDVPVPVRVFLDRRRMLLLLMPVAMGIPLSVDLLRNPGMASPLVMGVVLACVAIGIPVGIILVRLRRLLRLGYGPDDIASGLRASFARRREEFLFEFGRNPSVRERVFRAIGTVGLVLGAGLSVSILAGFGRPVVVGVTVIALYLGLIAAIVSAKWRRLRRGTGPVWGAFWEGQGGRALARTASLNLGQRAVPAGRPTELGILMSAEAIYQSLPKELRRSLGDVPEVLQGLEVHARSVRAHLEELDAALVEAQHEPAHVASERQGTLVADLREARARSETRLAEVVMALENLRLDLLRIRAGTGPTEGITRDLAAARALGEGVDRLLAGRREVEEVLAKRSGSLERQGTPKVE